MTWNDLVEDEEQQKMEDNELHVETGFIEN